MYRLIALLILALIMLASLTYSYSSQGFKGWKNIRVGEVFSFSIPSNLKVMDVKGIDSLIGSYRCEDLELTYDYGWYSDPLNYSNYPEYKEERVTIDGREAKIVTFKDTKQKQGLTYVTGIHIAKVNTEDEEHGQNRLTMKISSKKRDMEKIAREIFSSIKFIKK
jgi:hypothetical protein